MVESIFNSFEDDDCNYQGLQIQFNCCFCNGWVWFNNVIFLKVEGCIYGGGNGGNDLGVFNNFDDDYGWNMDVVFIDQLIEIWENDLVIFDDGMVMMFCGVNGLVVNCVDDL